MRRRKCLLLSFLMPFLLLLSCPDRRPSRAIEEEIDYGNTLVLGTHYPISPLDPLPLSGISAALVELVFNGLTEVDALQGSGPTWPRAGRPLPMASGGPSPCVEGCGSTMGWS